jgi:hypothetical protein
VCRDSRVRCALALALPVHSHWLPRKLLEAAPNVLKALSFIHAVQLAKLSFLHSSFVLKASPQVVFVPEYTLPAKQVPGRGHFQQGAHVCFSVRRHSRLQNVPILQLPQPVATAAPKDDFLLLI